MELIEKQYKLNIRCFTINLENKPERMKTTIRELAKINIIPERFNAIRHEYGAIGCGLSHIGCIQKAIDEDLPYVMICEDDIQILDHTELIDNLYKFVNNINKWDVLLLSANNFRPFEEINQYCIRPKNALTTGFYIVRKHYYKSLINIFKKAVEYMIKEPKDIPIYAIDQMWKYLQRKDDWYLLIPVNIIQRPGYSDIMKQEVNYSHMRFYDKTINDPIYN